MKGQSCNTWLPFVKYDMYYIIELVGAHVMVDVPFPVYPNESTTEFFRFAEDDGHADIRLELVPVNHLPDISDIRYVESRRIYVGEGTTAGTFFSANPNFPPYAFVSRCMAKNKYLRCEYLPGNEKYMNYARNLLTLMDVEATLLDLDALVLHASLIRYKEQGIIFSAPSGTGKSTQAELWRQYTGADVLNGDRAALRMINGVWTAYGLPYAGTSGIYRNESTPLRAVIALRQSPENSIRRITGTEAFRYLYPETMIHRWDPEFEQKAAVLLLRLMDDVPVFLLECRPDREAVILLRDTLEMK